MSRRRLNLSVTASNPDDAARLLDQLGETIKDRNVRVNLQSDNSSDAEPDQFRCTSRDEQLETDAGMAMGRGLAKAESAIEAKGDASEDSTDRVEAIVSARKKLRHSLGDLIKRGYECTVRAISAGVSDSTLNK